MADRPFSSCPATESAPRSWPRSAGSSTGWPTRRGLAFDVEEDLVGGCAYDAHGAPLTDATMAKAQAADAVLLGAVGGPKYDDARLQREARARPAAAAQGDGPLRQPAPGAVLRRARRLLVAQARGDRRARHPDRARTDQRRLFRRAARHLPGRQRARRDQHPALHRERDRARLRAPPSSWRASARTSSARWRRPT